MTLFNSHIKTLRITITASRPIYEQGVRLGDTQGEYAKFENGRFQADDKRVVEKLEKHPGFGIKFWKVSDGESKPAASAAGSEADLESFTKVQLLELAKKRNIEVEDGLGKPELIERLKAK